MKYENLSTPVYLLHKGVDKLIQYGMSTFEVYADEADLGFCDRNRIIAKCKLVAPGKGFKELECPKSMHGARWFYYTKRLRYSDDAARDVIRRIDESCASQFTPRNPQELTRNILQGVPK